MDALKSLVFEWYNAVFVIPVTFWIIYMFVMMAGGIGVDYGVDHDLDHDLDHDHDFGGGHHGLFFDLLSFLGVGRCPLSIGMMVFGMVWGFVGLGFNGFFSNLKLLPPGLHFWASFAIATIISMFVTRFIALNIAKIMPKEGSTAISVENLVGRSGQASVEIDSVSGRAKVRDEHGALHNINCKTDEGDEPVSENSEIMVLAYIEEEKMFIVKQKPTIGDI